MRLRAWCRVLKCDTKRMTRKRKKLMNLTSSKLRTLALQKALLEGLKDKLQTGRKHLQITSDKGLRSRIYKEFSKCNFKTTITNNAIKNGQKM